MDEKDYIARLKTLRMLIADEALTKPEARTEFSYGHAVGMNHGLRRAEQEFLEMLKSEKEKDV